VYDKVSVSYIGTSDIEFILRSLKDEVELRAEVSEPYTGKKSYYKAGKA